MLGFNSRKLLSILAIALVVVGTLALFATLSPSTIQRDNGLTSGDSNVQTKRRQVASAVGSATLTAVGDFSVSGTVTFTLDGSSVIVDADLSGVSAGVHGLHVHTYGDLTNPSDGTSAGGHWNPSGAAHGCPPNVPRHSGDMGNWTASSDGTLRETKTLDLLQLTGGQSIIGRAVVLHAEPDLCNGTSGFAGARQAFGVIGVTNLGGDSNDAVQELDSISHAVCVLQPTTNCPECSGVVHFVKQEDDSILVVGEFDGLELNSPHGIHVHQYGDISKTDGTSAGGHWNPDGNLHNVPDNRPRHQGDLGSIQSYDVDTLKAYYQYQTTYFHSLESLVGRGMIIHQRVDHGAGEGCDQAGSAGPRMLMGVIGAASTDTVEVNVPESVTVNNTWVSQKCSSFWSATAYLQPTEGNTGTGTVVFTENSDGTVHVKAHIEGITEVTNGVMPLHVHQYGDLTANDGTSTGGHYVGDGSETHGCPPSDTRHEGDMGNFTVVGGVLDGEKDLDLLAINILGRGVVLHAAPDTCDGATGNAGARIAVGAIGIPNGGTGYVIDENDPVEFAVTVMSGTTNCPECGGTVWFTPNDEGLLIQGQFDGLTSGNRYGIHLHVWGDISATDGTSCGGHFNPNNLEHGLPPSAGRHVGDLGNIHTFSGETGYYSYQFTDFVNINDILGRAVVVHAWRDHGAGAGCDQAGSAGARLMRGVIGRTAAVTVPANFPTVTNAFVNINCDGSGGGVAPPPTSYGTTAPVTGTFPTTNGASTKATLRLVSLALATVLVVLALA